MRYPSRPLRDLERVLRWERVRRGLGAISMPILWIVEESEEAGESGEAESGESGGGDEGGEI